MTTILEQSTYLNGTNFEPFKAQLDNFYTELLRKDKSKTVAKRYINRIRNAIDCMLIVRPWFTLEDLNAKDFRNMSDNLSYFSDREVRAILKQFGQFVEFCGGNNPFYEFYGVRKRNPDWSEGLEGEFLFEKELDSYRTYLEDTGCGINWISAKSNMISKCCRVLNRMRMVRKLEEITKKSLDYLYSLMTNLPHRHATNYVSSLNDFVKFTIGNDCLQDYRDERHRYRLPNTPQAEEFRTALEAYLAEITERRFHKGTVQNYSLICTKIYCRLTEIHGPLSLDKIDKHKIRSLADAFEDRGQTVKRNLGVFGRFIQFTLGKDPVKEAGLLFNYEPTKKTFIDNRDFMKMDSNANITGRLILSLGAAMGVRRSEMAEISLDDIDGDILTVTGKGHGCYGKRAEMDIPPETRELLDEYLEYRKTLIGEVDRSQGKLFVRDSHKKGTPYDFNSIGYLMEKVADAVGVDASCHTLRRLCANNLFEDYDIAMVQQVLRHSHSSTTYDSYIRYLESKRKAAVRRASSKLYD